MNIHLKSTLLLLAALAGTGLVCTHDGPVAGIEVTNGDCTGTIYRQDSTVAPGAVVRLIPALYDPHDPSTGSVDSTTTDKAGHYAFDVAKADFYNIIADKDGASSISESVPLQPQATVVVNDTLQEPGKLAGRVSVKPEDDARNVVILIRGTGMYTVPTDSAGNFATPPLPAGTFTVQIFFTGGDEYVPFDTLITILSGKTTNLLVTLPSANAPTVNGLSVQYDSVTMYATLSWDRVDTSKIESYAIYRNSAAGKDTVLFVDKSASSCIDDVVFLERDTVTYTIASIGKNYKEGYHRSSNKRPIRSAHPCTKTLVMQLDCATFPGFTADRRGNIFATNYSYIQKMDSNGIKIKTYSLNADSFSFGSQDRLLSDDKDNLYAVITTPTRKFTLAKFDNDLNLIRTSQEIDTIDMGTVKSFAVSGDGTVFFIITHGRMVHGALEPTESRHIRVFSPDLIQTNDYVISSNKHITQTFCFGDTIVLKERPFDFSCTSNEFQSFHQLYYYDRNLTCLGSVENNHYLKPFVPASMDFSICFGNGSPDAGPGGLLVAYAQGLRDEQILYICDRERKLLCRKTTLSKIFFDYAGNYYLPFKFSDNSTIKANRYSIR